MYKKGQGINAAVLVAIIAGLIIIYFIFLPASERERLLENKTTTTTAKSEDKKIFLLKESPGEIDFIQAAEDKSIPNVYLFESTNAKELETINPFRVRNGVLDKKAHTVEFSVSKDTTSNIVLSFRAKTHKGILTIKLNDEIIYENEILSETVPPISLKDKAMKNDNVLEFSVSSVGWKFWSTNEYAIEDGKITGDITDTSRQKGQNVFSMSSSEFQNLDKATLTFIPYCSSSYSVGNLEIFINDKNIFSAVPACDDKYVQSIPTGVFDSGENTIIFKTSKGSYSVEQITLQLESKETNKIKYFFDVNETTYDKIKNNDADAELQIQFTKDLEGENKNAELNINGHFTTMELDPDEDTFTKNLDNWIEEDNNYIEIKPKMRLYIKELRVELID